MAFLHLLLTPHSLEITDSNVAEKMEWVEGDVGTLRCCFKNDQRRWHSSSCHWTWSQKVFKTWNLSASQHKDINNVIKRFGNYCNLRKSILFECYHFNSQQQKPGESFDCCITTLRQIACKCTIDTIMPDDNLRDRIIFGVTDNKVRERLLHKPKLNLAKTLDICHASEMSQAQIKAVSKLNPSKVH